MYSWLWNHALGAKFVKMRKKAKSYLSCLALSLAVVLLGIPGTGRAQGESPTVRTPGIIASMDCAAQTFALNAPNGVEQFSASQYTFIYTSTERLDFCKLSQFVGVLATVWSSAVDSQQVAGRIDILVSSGTGVGFLTNDSGQGNPGGPQNSSNGSGSHSGGGSSTGGNTGSGGGNTTGGGDPSGGGNDSGGGDDHGKGGGDDHGKGGNNSGGDDHDKGDSEGGRTN